MIQNVKIFSQIPAKLEEGNFFVRAWANDKKIDVEDVDTTKKPFKNFVDKWKPLIYIYLHSIRNQRKFYKSSTKRALFTSGKDNIFIDLLEELNIIDVDHNYLTEKWVNKQKKNNPETKVEAHTKSYKLNESINIGKQIRKCDIKGNKKVDLENYDYFAPVEDSGTTLVNNIVYQEVKYTEHLAKRIELAYEDEKESYKKAIEREKEKKREDESYQMKEITPPNFERYYLHYCMADGIESSEPEVQDKIDKNVIYPQTRGINSRLESAFVGMNENERKTLSYEGERFVEVDWCNAEPTTILGIMKEEFPNEFEEEKYQFLANKIITGQFYEHIRNSIKYLEEWTRDEVKAGFFAVLQGNKNFIKKCSNSDVPKYRIRYQIYKFMKDRYEYYYRTMDKIGWNSELVKNFGIKNANAMVVDSKMEKERNFNPRLFKSISGTPDVSKAAHNQLTHRESNVVNGAMNTIFERFGEKAKGFRVHDAIWIRESLVEETKEILEQSAYNELDVKCKFKINY